MYKAIIFDFFGVIAPDFYRVWLEKNGYKRTGEFLRIAQDIDSGAVHLDEYYKRLSILSGQPAQSLQSEFENQTRLDRNVLQLISTLHHNYQVSLVTNSPSNLVRIILQKHKLDQYFDDIIISGEVGYVKPSRKIFEFALEKMKVPASETIFIDDLQPYVEGAQAVGITGIKFDSIAQLTADLEKLGIVTC